MLKVNTDGSIELTRGDTARLTVNITDDAGQNYEPQEGDTLTLTVKTTVKDSEFLFQKTVTGSNLIHIEPTDTAGLDFNTYVYDVELATKNGDVYTIISKNKFKILEEVTTR